MKFIQLEPYPPQMAVVFSKEQHDEVCAKINLPDFGKWGDTHQSNATTYGFNCDGHPYRLIVVEFYHPKELRFNTISHEAIHVMSSLMEYVGLEYDVNNDEWYAYQHDFIVDAICTAYDKFMNAKPTIATGNHPVVNEQEVFSLDNLNADNNSFLDDK